MGVAKAFLTGCLGAVMAQLCMSVLDRAFVGQEKEAAVSFKFLQLQGTLNLHLKVSYQVCSAIDTAKIAYNRQ